MLTLEKKILARIQQDINISQYIYRDLAEELNIQTNYLIKVLKKYKKNNTIRNIAALLNIKNIGYQSTLAAIKVDRKDLNSSAQIINSHPGVSHNYLRNHDFNLWFTLAIPQNHNIKKEISDLAKDANALDYIILPEVDRLKLKVFIPFHNNIAHNKTSSLNSKNNTTPYTLSDFEKTVLEIIQHNLPLKENALELLIKNSRHKIDINHFISTINNLKQKKIIRRYAAVLNQQAAGYNNNALVTWQIENLDSQSLKEICNNFSEISHAYLRKSVPGKWSHPLFTMIHARNSNELTITINNFIKYSGLTNYLVLESIKEYKKQAVRYFSETSNIFTGQNYD